MFPYLEFLVLVPVAAGLILSLVPSVSGVRGLYRGIGVVVSAVLLVVSIVMALAFKVGVTGYQFASSHQWIPQLGISWSLGADGIALVLVLLTTILFPIALFGAGAQRDEKSFVAWMLVLEGACLGSFLATDLFDFFVLFELTLIPTYFLIANWGLAGSARAATKFFVYTFLGSAFLLVGILALVSIHARDTGSVTFAIATLRHTVMSSTTAKYLFLAFTAAFVVKAPVFPFHTWSPDAYGEAPPSGAVILAGVMAKLGTYGIIRFDFELFPQASRSLAWLMLTLAVVGIVYGAVVAAGERNLAKVVAYSSLSHMGFIVLGLFAFTSEGLSGSVLQMFNHGIYTAALFLLIGMIYARRKTLDTTELGGLQGKAPVLAGIFMVIMLASIGLPGLNGFIGEFMILLGGFLGHRWWAVAGATGVILSAIYLLWAYQKVFHRAPKTDHPFADLKVREILTLVPLVVIVVGLGVFPSLFLSRINPSVHQVLQAHGATTNSLSLSMPKAGK
jgi:NADH-quinone oxidoreductase subunit M